MIEVPPPERASEVPAATTGQAREGNGAGVRRSEWIAAAMGCLVVAFTWMPPEIGAPNERSRIYLAHSLAARGETSVNQEVQRWGMIFDIARRNGDFYSDKAPGSSVLSVPSVWLALEWGREADVNQLIQVVRTTVMLPLVLLLAVAMFRILRRLGVHPHVRMLCVCSLMMGTPILHYGHAVFGHVMVAAAVAAVMFSLLAALESRGGRRALWASFCGAFAGLAFSIEYQAVIVALALGLALLVHPATRAPKVLAAASLGLALPVAATLWYNALAFGSPLSTSYEHLHHQYSAKLHGAGIGGVTVPTFESLVGLLLSPSRGLLFCAATVLWGVTGVPALWRRSRPLCVFACPLFLGYLYVGLASNIWYGGWGFGPRLLIPLMVPGVVAFACRFDTDRDKRRVGWAVASVLVPLAVGYNVLVTSLWPEIPPEFENPLVSLAPVLVAQDFTAANLGFKLFGLEGLWGVVPLWVGVASWMAWLVTQQWRSAGATASHVGAAVLVLLCWAGALAAYPQHATAVQAKRFAESLEPLRQPAALAPPPGPDER